AAEDGGPPLHRAVEPPIEVDELVEVPLLQADFARGEDLQGHARQHHLPLPLDLVERTFGVESEKGISLGVRGCHYAKYGNAPLFCRAYFFSLQPGGAETDTQMGGFLEQEVVGLSGAIRRR